MIWLGSKRGYLTDWLTQRWVEFTGRRISLTSHPWLEGPTAPTSGITTNYFARLAHEHGLELDGPDASSGILRDFGALLGPSFVPGAIDPAVRQFYEQTSVYELDVWSHWCGAFRPFGWLLAVLFSRRLQQLNVPLSGLDTSKGVTNEVLRFLEPGTGHVLLTAWYRRLHRTGHVLYAGFYGVCEIPGCENPCVKVVFPLPNGNAIVIMRCEARDDGSFVITSAGERFGDPGFYFTVQGDPGEVRARYLRALRESIHVYPADGGTVRADHLLRYFGITFLRIHYRMRRRQGQAAVAHSAASASTFCRR